MKTTPMLNSLVKVVKVPRGWKELELVDKVGIVRHIFPTFGNREIVFVEFVSWSRGHDLFGLLESKCGWYFYPEYLEPAI
jgi:hypothetical protein